MKCIAADGLKWHERKALAHIDAGHLRQSAESSGRSRNGRTGQSTVLSRSADVFVEIKTWCDITTWFGLGLWVRVREALTFRFSGQRLV